MPENQPTVRHPPQKSLVMGVVSWPSARKMPTLGAPSVVRALEADMRPRAIVALQRRYSAHPHRAWPAIPPWTAVRRRLSTLGRRGYAAAADMPLGSFAPSYRSFGETIAGP